MGYVPRNMELQYGKPMKDWRGLDNFGEKKMFSVRRRSKEQTSFTQNVTAVARHRDEIPANGIPSLNATVTQQQRGCELSIS